MLVSWSCKQPSDTLQRVGIELLKKKDFPRCLRVFKRTFKFSLVSLGHIVTAYMNENVVNRGERDWRRRARLHRHSHRDYGDGDKPKNQSGGWVGGTDTPAAGSYGVVTGCGLDQVLSLALQHPAVITMSHVQRHHWAIVKANSDTWLWMQEYHPLVSWESILQ